jgi:hypothetical protein
VAATVLLAAQPAADSWRRLGATTVGTVEMVAARPAAGAEPGERVRDDDREFILDRADRLLLPVIDARVDDGQCLILIDGAHHGAFARRSHARHEMFDAMLVDGRLATVAHYRDILLTGDFSIDDPAACQLLRAR